MVGEVAISLNNVSKVFKRYQKPIDRLKEVLFPEKSHAKEFWALQGITLEIPKGETWGVIGRNGAGKSTLLKIITGTLRPTAGEVQVNGRVSALLELGSGFNPEFTGKQNVFFNGRLLGLTREEIENQFDEIVSFADIGDFLDQPVKTYSSGMRARLAFSVASSVNPDILIVDEVLGVGDAAFQHKCAKRMRNMMEKGTTTLFVSHNAGSVKSLCTWSVMLHQGKTRAFGKPDAVLAKYMKMITDEQVNRESQAKKNEIQKEKEIAPKQKDKDFEIIQALPKSFRRGSGKAKIETISLLTSEGRKLVDNGFCPFNDELTLIVQVRTTKALTSAILGFYICDRNGNEVIGSNTIQEGVEINSIAKNSTLEVEFKFRVPLKPGYYSLTVAGSEDYNSPTFDWVDNIITFSVLQPSSGKKIHAMVYVPMQVEMRSKVSEYTSQLH